MKKNLISGKIKRINGFKFLVIILILAIALVYGVKMTQQNQENRSKAADGSSTPAIGKTYLWGPSNTSNCKNASGTCAYFNNTWSTGKPCVVNGISGWIKTGLCLGGYSTLCCSTRKPCYINGNIYPDGATFCNGINRVYVCDNGNQLYRGLDCATSGKMCNQGRCVTGTDYGAEKCVAKGGICKTTNTGTLPTSGTACTVNGRAGKYWIGLCGGQYGTNFMCCVPN